MRISQVFVRLLYGLCLALIALAPAPSQDLSLTSDPVSALLRRGDELEGARRWGDALSHFEEALREHPQQADLLRRYETAKTRYDITRRGADASFLSAVDRLDGGAALDLYGEVLLKVQTHYVDEPDWNRLVIRGVVDLDAALQEPAFLKRHLARDDQRRIDGLRAELWRTVGPQPIRNRHEARAAIERVSRACAQYAGLRPTPVVMECLCGATQALDDYSGYLTGAQLEEVYSQIDGNFVGLGIELKAAEGALRVVRVIPDSPAHRGGLAADDLIVAIDGRSLAGLDTDAAANLLQGPPGSSVQVTARSSAGQTRTLSLARQQVDVPSIEAASIIDPAQGIAYFKLTSFQKTTTREMDTALWNLHRAGMRWLVIDLRGNPGGLLTAAVETADRFIDNGMIVSTHGRHAGENYSYAAHRTGTWSVPLAVLIDGDSASASEIFAGAIRDHQRGTLIGARSYGKGSVQGIFPLSRGNAGLRLTTAKFYSPRGLAFSRVGVEPHMTVREAAKPIVSADGGLGPAAPADAALEAALQLARGQLARR